MMDQRSTSGIVLDRQGNKWIATAEGLLEFNQNGIISSAHSFDRSQIADFELDRNFPNPFDPTTTIEYRIHKSRKFPKKENQINTRPTVRFLFVFAALLILQFTATGQKSLDSLGLVQPLVDKTDTSAKYSSDWRAYLTRKYGLMKKGDLPAYLQKLDFPIQQLDLLIKDQNITEDEFIRFKIGNRLEKLCDGLKLDSQARALVRILRRPADSQADSSALHSWKALGVAVMSLSKTAAGGMVVRGYVPVLKIEAIANDTSTSMIQMPIYPGHNMGAYTTQGDNIIKASDARKWFYLGPNDNSPVTAPEIGLISDGMENYSKSQNSTGSDGTDEGCSRRSLSLGLEF